MLRHLPLSALPDVLLCCMAALLGLKGLRPGAAWGWWSPGHAATSSNHTAHQDHSGAAIRPRGSTKRNPSACLSVGGRLTVLIIVGSV